MAKIGKLNVKLFETKFGSQVYGTALPTSDVDVGRVTLETPEQIFGIRGDEVISQKIVGGLDLREMYLKRFVKLCVDGNPNVLEWLYTPVEHIEYLNGIFNLNIVQNATLLLQREKVIVSHLGFAKSQILKMRKHEQEMGAKRRELYAKYGYDVKYASHALRLTYQLRDLLLEGAITFPYPPQLVEKLKAIKTGMVTLAEFDHIYEVTSKETEEIIADKSCHKIQEKVDFNLVAELLQNTYESLWNK